MKELRKILSKVLGINPGKINEETSPQNTQKWDSLHGLILVVELENHYKLKFTMEEILSVRNVGDIIKTLKKYGVRFDEYPIKSKRA